MADKRRKSTNTKRKEEISELKGEIRRLESELELQSLNESLQHPQLTPVTKLWSENKALKTAARQQQLALAKLHSALTPPLVRHTSSILSSKADVHVALLVQQEGHPLCTRICLKKSWEERKAALLALREEKFKSAYDFVSTRSEFTSDQPQFTEERYETADGDVCCVIYHTAHFPGAKSLKQVYDAVLFSLDNVEISITERLGHTTVRDDYNGVDGNIYNARVVSTNDMGITTEVSGIMFSHLFTASDDRFGGTPCGILVIDSVDEDELYPYVPSERVRKDVSAVFVLTADKPQHKPASTSSGSTTDESNDEEELVVTLRRAAFVKLHSPEFELSEADWQELQQDVAQWGDITTRGIRSVLYSVP